MEIKIMGGLGNQLFIYAFARSLQEEYGGLVKLVSNNNSISLSSFNVVPFELEVKTNYKIMNNMDLLQKYYYFKYKLACKLNFNNKLYDFKTNYEKKNQEKFNDHNLVFCTFEHNNFYIKNKEKVYIEGFFATEKHFKKIKDKIKNELKPIQPVLPKNRGIYEQICNTNSVCLHIRRGDYLKNDMFRVCGEKYYNNCILEIKKQLSNPIFYLFSNDKEYLREYYGNRGLEYIIVEDDGDPDYETLRLMSTCKHFIIANSTFSWWAQYLSNNEDKIVLAPERWYAEGYEYPCDIWLDNWKLMKV